MPEKEDQIGAVMWSRILKVLAEAIRHGHTLIVLNSLYDILLKATKTEPGDWFTFEIEQPGSVHPSNSSRNRHLKIELIIMGMGNQRRRLLPG